MKIDPLLVISEGEESHEDSLKITSDKNLMKPWIWIFISHVLDSRSSCDYELSKCLNSQTWKNGFNNQNHAHAMKIRPKTEKWTWLHMKGFFIMDHEETSLIWIRDVFQEIRLKISFYNPRWKILCHGVRWKKSLKFGEKMIYVLKMVWEV